MLEQISVADAALEICIAQNISDQGITRLEQFKQLICTHSGIVSVSGLEQLAFIERLVLNDNELIAITSLAKLERLAHLHLAGNSQLECSQIEALQKTKANLQIAKPSQCE